MGNMRTLSPSGDVKLSWDPNKDDEVEVAKKVFEEKTKSGWSAFRDKGAGTKGDKIKAFDRYAERIILALPLSPG